MPQIETKKKFRRSFSGTNGEEFHLESYLWESANILRGHVDASDFKAYIFPLLFYKRISDVYDEEYQKALDESNGDEEYASSEINHRFQIPKNCHWTDLRKKSKNIGQFLQKSLRDIEKSNPDTLFGIFGDTNWGNKEKITDAMMIELINHFSKIDLSNSKIQPTLLGDSYEYLIKRFADLTNKKAGEFYTPRSVVKLLTKILEPLENETIYDPACGTGGMLLESIDYVQKNGGDVRRLKLYGQEINLNTAAIARINLFLHGIDDFKISRGDTLRNPSFHEDDKLLKFDCVIANPPFSLKNWGYEVWKNDAFGRAKYGLPPESFGDFSWIQHMIASMKESTGRLAVVLSTGSLYRSQERQIRKNLIQADLLSAIIQLGTNLFYGTTISPCILIFKNKKEIKEKNNVLMVNASELYYEDRAQNYLLESHLNEIVDIIKNRKEKKYVSKIISSPIIEKHRWNLNVSRFLEIRESKNIFPLEQAIFDLKKSHNNFIKSQNKLKEKLTELNFFG